jgi:hypothetical protein
MEVSFCILNVLNVGESVDDKYNIVSQLLSFEVLSRRYRVLSCLQILNIVVLRIFGFPWALPARSISDIWNVLPYLGASSYLLR